MLRLLFLCILHKATAVPDVLLSSFSSTRGFKINGVASGDSSGYAVSRAGDFNGDGVGDIIIGAYQANAPTMPSRPRSGVVYVIFGHNVPYGQPDFTTMELSTLTSSTNGFRIFGAAGDDNLGASVSYAGDINGDRIDDIIIGAYMASPFPDRDTAGVTYVLFGKRAAPASFADVDLLVMVTGRTTGFRILGVTSGDYSGRAVSNAGDVNGDGIGDVIIGAYFASPSAMLGKNAAGVSYVVFGRNVTELTPYISDIDLLSVVSGSNVGFRILGANQDDASGRSVSSAGDINNDGVGDVIVGAKQADPYNRENAGAACIVFGSKLKPYNRNDIDLSSVTVNSQGFCIYGASSLDHSGVSVASAGDINGDGISDVVIGAYNADGAGGSSYRGVTYVLFGHTTTSSNPIADIDLSTIQYTPTVGFRILGAAANDQSGVSVSGGCDMNGDGVHDIVIGAFTADPTVPLANAGISYVIFGRKVGGSVAAFGDMQLSTINGGNANGFPIYGAASSDTSGYW